MFPLRRRFSPSPVWIPTRTLKYHASNHSLVLFDRGDEIQVQAGPEGIRFLLVSGKPIEEPVACIGPLS